MVRESRHLWVGNLPESIQGDVLETYFKRFGDVCKVRFLEELKSENGRNCTIAFIDIKSASKAHNSGKHFLEGRLLEIGYYDPSSSSFSSSSTSTENPPSGRLPGSSSSSSIDNDRSHPSLLARNHRLPLNSIKDADDSCSNSAAEQETSRAALQSSRSQTGSPSGLNEEKRTPKDVEEDSASFSVTRRRSSTAHSETKEVPRLSDHISGQMSESAMGASRSCSVDNDSQGEQQRDHSPANSDSIFDTLSPDKRPLAICVRNLPTRSSDSSLKDGLFHDYKKFGKIVAVKVQGSGSDRHGIICFKRPEDVEKACEGKERKFFGATVKVIPRKEPVTLVEADFRLKDDELDEYHPKATRTLYVGDLEKAVVQEDLKETFDCFGEILDVDIKRQATGSSYAFVQFTNITSVVKALRKMDGFSLCGSRVKVGFGKSMPTNCVWCDNLPDKLPERKLVTYFARAGDVRYCSVNGERNQGLIFFETVDFAQTAINDLKSKPFQGRRLQLDYASRECQAAFFQEMERSGQMTVDRKPLWETFSHPAVAGRFVERDAVLTDARVHLNSRTPVEASGGGGVVGGGRVKRDVVVRSKSTRQSTPDPDFPAVRSRPAVPAFNREDSYERELRDYGFSQRERRVDRRRDDNPPKSPSRRTTYRQPTTDLIQSQQQHDLSDDGESICSDRSEHSSNRRFFRHLTSRSPSPVHSDSHNTKALTRRRRRTPSASPTSNPTSPTGSSGVEDVDRSRMRRRSSLKQSNIAAKRKIHRSESERHSGPHTPEGESPLMSPMRKSSNSTQLVISNADSNTPEVTSSKDDQQEPVRAPCPPPPLPEMGSDLVSSTVHHSTSPTQEDPNGRSSPESERSETKNEKSVLPVVRKATFVICGAIPDFYQTRIAKRSQLNLQRADLQVPKFASKGDQQPEVATPPSSPKLGKSFHDKLKALDEKFKGIPQIAEIGMSGMKTNRSCSMNESLDKLEKGGLNIIKSEMANNSIENIISERMKNTSEKEEDVKPASNSTPLSNIARYSAHPKLTIRSVSSTIPTSASRQSSESHDSPEVKPTPATPSKPVTSDLTAKLLSLTAEASKTPSTSVHPSPSIPRTPTIKTEPDTKPEVKPSPLATAQNIFFSGMKVSEDTSGGKKTAVLSKSKPSSDSLFGVKPTPVTKKPEVKVELGEKKGMLKKRDSDTPSLDSASAGKSGKNKEETKSNLSNKFALFGQDPNVKMLKKKSSVSVSPEKPLKEEKEKFSSNPKPSQRSTSSKSLFDDKSAREKEKEKEKIAEAKEKEKEKEKEREREKEVEAKEREKEKDAKEQREREKEKEREREREKEKERVRKEKEERERKEIRKEAKKKAEENVKKDKSRDAASLFKPEVKNPDKSKSSKKPPEVTVPEKRKEKEKSEKPPPSSLDSTSNRKVEVVVKKEKPEVKEEARPVDLSKKSTVVKEKEKEKEKIPEVVRKEEKHKVRKVSISPSKSRSPSPTKSLSVAATKAFSEMSGSEKSEVRRGRKKKVKRRPIESSSESEGDSDDPPKKNIFEVSLNEEDLHCSMYDKIKRRTCTKVPASLPAPTSVSSRHSMIRSRDSSSIKETSPIAASKSKTLRSSSSSSSSSSEEVVSQKEDKYHSPSTMSSPDSSSDEKNIKRHSVSKKSPKKPPSSKSRHPKFSDGEDSSDSSDSSIRSKKRLTKKISKKEKKRPKKAPVSTKPSSKKKISDSSSDSDSEVERRKKRTPSPKPPKKKKSKIEEPEVKVAKKQKSPDKEKKTLSPERRRELSPRKSIERPHAPVRAPVEDKDDYDTYNLSLLMKTSFMENPSRESSVASPAAALTPKPPTPLYHKKEGHKKSPEKRKSNLETVASSPEKEKMERKSTGNEKSPRNDKSPSGKRAHEDVKSPTPNMKSPPPNSLSKSTSKSSPEIKRTPSPEKPSAPVPLTKPSSPPIIHIPPPLEPVSAASTEDRITRNLEEEMMAAEMLQRIMDDEPSQDMDPVIHIPEREDDVSYSDEGGFEQQFQSQPEAVQLRQPEVVEPPKYPSHQPEMNVRRSEVENCPPPQQQAPQPPQVRTPQGVHRSSSEALVDDHAAKRAKNQKEEEMRLHMMNMSHQNYNQRMPTPSLDMENQMRRQQELMMIQQGYIPVPFRPNINPPTASNRMPMPREEPHQAMMQQQQVEHGRGSPGESKERRKERERKRKGSIPTDAAAQSPVPSSPHFLTDQQGQRFMIPTGQMHQFQQSPQAALLRFQAPGMHTGFQQHFQPSQGQNAQSQQQQQQQAQHMSAVQQQQQQHSPHVFNMRSPSAAGSQSQQQHQQQPSPQMQQHPSHPSPTTSLHRSHSNEPGMPSPSAMPPPPQKTPTFGPAPSPSNTQPTHHHQHSPQNQHQKPHPHQSGQQRSSHAVPPSAPAAVPVIMTNTSSARANAQQHQQFGQVQQQQQQHQNQQQSQQQPNLQKENVQQQNRGSAIQGAQAGASHRGSSGAQQQQQAPPPYPQQQQQQQQQQHARMQPSLDAAHQFALMQMGMTRDPVAMAKLLQHQNPQHHPNLPEHPTKDQAHQQQQGQQAQSSHVGRPEALTLQQQMEKNRAQENAVRQQAALLAARSRGVPGMAFGAPGMEGMQLFPAPFVYSPYGFTPADLGQPMEGSIPISVTMENGQLRMFRAPFIPPGMQVNEAAFQQAMQHQAQQQQQQQHHQSQENRNPPVQQPQQHQVQVQQQPEVQRVSMEKVQQAALFQPIWQGTLALKNDHALVKMLYVGGNQELAKASLPLFADPTQNTLKISQRMRLEPSQMEGVVRRMEIPAEHCILLAVVTGKNAQEEAVQAEMLMTGFINYLTQKQAAGIVNVYKSLNASQPQQQQQPPNPQQQISTIHIFPPNDFTKRSLAHFGAQVMRNVEQTPHLFVVITIHDHQ